MHHWLLVYSQLKEKWMKSMHKLKLRYVSFDKHDCACGGGTDAVLDLIVVDFKGIHSHIVS